MPKGGVGALIPALFRGPLCFGCFSRPRLSQRTAGELQGVAPGGCTTAL